MNPQKTTIAILATLSATSLALADDFKTNDGKEYKNATVTRVEGDGIVVKTKGGISKLYFAELPADVRERFHLILPRRLPPKPPPFDKQRRLTRRINKQKNSVNSKKLLTQNSPSRG